jgi:hypothetical protein
MMCPTNFYNRSKFVKVYQYFVIVSINFIFFLLVLFHHTHEHKVNDIVHFSYMVF